MIVLLTQPISNLNSTFRSIIGDCLPGHLAYWNWPKSYVTLESCATFWSGEAHISRVQLLSICVMICVGAADDSVGGTGLIWFTTVNSIIWAVFILVIYMAGIEDRIWVCNLFWLLPFSLLVCNFNVISDKTSYMYRYLQKSLPMFASRQNWWNDWKHTVTFLCVELKNELYFPRKTIFGSN